MTDSDYCVVLRLAGPLQSWGGRGQFNRRDTLNEPTKSGIIGLLAAAQGLRRQDPIDKLLGLTLGVRTDQPGTLLRDYHTVSDYRGQPLLAAAVNAKGRQKPTAPAKYTHVTQRFYLQDAVFTAAVSGPAELLRTLAKALRQPAFPLALGRRSCPPSRPLLVTPVAVDEAAGQDDLWAGTVLDVLSQVPWQITKVRRRQLEQQGPRKLSVTLPVTVDDPDGNDVRTDLPTSFNPLDRGFNTRRVRQHWIDLPTGWSEPADPGETSEHDPFDLLGG